MASYPTNQPLKYVLTIGLLIAGLIGGWFVFSQAAKPLQAQKIATAEPSGSGILDGMTFVGELGPVGKPADVKDNLIFANGMFASVECDRRCGYPAGPYFVRHVGDKIEFVSESNCTYKDAKISWRGTIENGTLKGGFTWTSSRWYWTIEKDFWFEGKLVAPTSPAASNQ